MREQGNSPTELFSNMGFETIHQQILIQTLFRPEFTTIFKAPLKHPVTYFLNHPIAYFPNIQSPFTKSCSSKWQQNVAGVSIIKKSRESSF